MLLIKLTIRIGSFVLVRHPSLTVRATFLSTRDKGDAMELTISQLTNLQCLSTNYSHDNYDDNDDGGLQLIKFNYVRSLSCSRAAPAALEEDAEPLPHIFYHTR